MRTQTKEIQDRLTPKDAYNILVEGNKRFMQNLKAQRNLQEQVFETSKGQFPFAVIHSCIDSRVPAELVFDQGIGDIFSTRVAGNVINEDVLGSMEYGCKVAGSKIVVVLGHTKCGAVTAACQNVELGNITLLLKKINPSVALVSPSNNVFNDDSIEKVAALNVAHSISRIRAESPILKEMEESDEIKIVGAIYNVADGEVRFL
jgi:carbonic anhydrase